MSSYWRSSLWFHYMGLIIVSSMLLGGGTTQGLWTDHLLGLIMLPAMWIGFGRIGSNRLSTAARALTLLVVALLLLPLMPMFRSIQLPDGSAAIVGWALLSPAPQRSLEAALFAFPVLGFFLYVCILDDVDQARILRLLIVGFAVNFVIGVVQLSYGQQVAISDALPYPIRSGLFTNENHFASLIYLALPILAYQCLAYYRQIVIYIILCLVISGFLLAVGSRAGIFLSSSLAVLCLTWSLTPAIHPQRKLLVCAILVVTGMFVGNAAGLFDLLEGDARQVIFRATWRAIEDYWPTGSGIGSFVLIYPIYEAPDTVASYFVNHAHNEYLQVLLEAGLAGAVAVTAYLVLVIINFGRSELAQAAFLSVAAVLVHSTVDYPLRTMAIAVPFAYLSAVILSTKALPGTSGSRSGSDLAKVRHRRS